MITFVEDRNFTRDAGRLLTETELIALMTKIAKSPDAGVLIPGSGGCRKLRFSAKGKGSRGGARVIYAIRPGVGQVRLLAIYAKGEKDNLSAREIGAFKLRDNP